MPENNEQNFDEPNQQNPSEERAVGAAAGAPFQTEAQEMKAQRGGAQEDQIVGETAEGATPSPQTATCGQLLSGRAGRETSIPLVIERRGAVERHRGPRVSSRAGPLRRA